MREDFLSCNYYYLSHLTRSALGTQLLSVSTDGLACVWHTDMLATPQRSIELHAPTPALAPARATAELAVTCAAPLRGDEFVVGTEEGALYRGTLADRPGTRAGLETVMGMGVQGQGKAKGRGHRAPVTRVAVEGRGRVLVSAAMDWTLRLWSLGMILIVC